MKKIKVLIVDDSALVREMFSTILSEDPMITVVGTAVDPYDAREKIKSLHPDVITLDIEMPKMDGIEFLKKIMSLRPMPVVMVSSLTQKGAQITLDALEIGAVDYVPKTSSESFDVGGMAEILIEKVKAAARAKVASPSRSIMRDKPAPLHMAKVKAGKVDLIAIGSSTGGVEALRDVVTLLPADIPPVIITQHMPIQFTATFAKRLDQLSTVTVKEAREGDVLQTGHVYIAPGSDHLVLAKKGGKYACKLHDGEKVSGHRPSVDVMMESVAEIAGNKAVGVILTGMGKDGAKGLLQMKKAGSFTLGQDEESCIVYGMPKAAYLAGAVSKQVPLKKMASEILQSCV